MGVRPGKEPGAAAWITSNLGTFVLEHIGYLMQTVGCFPGSCPVSSVPVLQISNQNSNSELHSHIKSEDLFQGAFQLLSVMLKQECLILTIVFDFYRRRCLVLCKGASSVVSAGWSVLQHNEENHRYLLVLLFFLPLSSNLQKYKLVLSHL